MQEKKIELNFISAHFSELDTQEQELINNSLCNISLKLEINNKVLKKFETVINK